MNTKYQLSDYVKKISNGDYTAFFNGLTMKKVYGKKAVMEAVIKGIQEPYTKGADRNIDLLIANDFFIEPGFDQDRFNEIKSGVGKINISNIVMIVDNRCNYRCLYCQIEENMEDEQKKHKMSIETAKNALDLYEKNISKDDKKTITITGGEPLMNIDTVKYIIERSKDITNSRTIIFTNGSMVTEELSDYFSKTDTLMLVSLDGPRDIHDEVRKTIGGQGTYDISLRGYELLKKAGCKTGISSVTGTHNVDRMVEVADLFERLEPPSIGFNFGHYLLGKENPTSIKMGKFAELLTEFYSYMRTRGIFVENISRFITPFFQEQPRTNECQAQGRGFSVDSRGKFGVCKSLLVSDEISKPISEVMPEISKEPVFQEWAMRSPFTLEPCVECKVIGVCGGGCTYDAYAINNKKIDGIDSRLCDYTNNVLDFLIWDLFEDIKQKIGDDIYIPNVDEQQEKYLRYYDPKNELQRSVGHEKDM